MVNTQSSLHILDLEHIYFIQAAKGPIYVDCSQDPERSLFALQSTSYEELRLLSHRACSAKDTRAIRAGLALHHIRNGWYAPSPDVWSFVNGEQIDPLPRVPQGGRKLTQQEAVQVFRLCHESGMAYRVIGARYGISSVSVGQIARGAVYRGLFKREAIPPGTRLPGAGRGAPLTREGDYYVSEMPAESPKYFVGHKRRGAKQ